MPKTVVIIGRKNGAGLEQDAELVMQALATGDYQVRCVAPRDWRAFLFGGVKADIVIYLERVFPWWNGRGKQRFLIPNQERFPARDIPRLGRMTGVLCKTRHAEEIFKKLHAAVAYTGFTSPDRSLADAGPDYERFFHLAGRSTVKGTDVLLALWTRHPEWPELTLVQHPDNAPAAVPANVRLISRRVSDAELKELQNTCGVHVCPSLSEGWGHYIVEAMSCRAVVVTTDETPMNELIAPERGLLVPAKRTESRHLGTNFYVDTAKLEQAITALVAQSTQDKERCGQNARVWFEENNRAFLANFPRLLGLLST
jgi:glycosyltransferase involved in cell wall biosynthesis